MLSNLSFRAAPRCTSQLKTGICFVTDDRLTAGDLEEFDSMPASELAENLSGPACKFRQARLFTIEDEEGELEIDLFRDVGHWWKGK